MKQTIFSYESVPAFGGRASELGKMISVYDNGEITSAVVQMDHKIISEEVLVKIPGIVLEIRKILDSHKREIDELPSEIRNSSLDGEFNRFTFHEKIVSGYNLNYHNTDDIKGDSRYIDAILYTNSVLDIFNEIVLLTNRYCIRHELLREKT